jgi:hypothetical protein
MGKPNYVHINGIGVTLMGPESLSDMCEQTAMRVSRLDANYRSWFDQLMEELTDNGNSDQLKQIAMSLAATQQEVKEIFQKVRGTSNPHVVTEPCPICRRRRTFDSSIGYCADCAQGDPIADLEGR